MINVDNLKINKDRKIGIERIKHYFILKKR